MMTSSALIFLLTLGIIASSILPADARSKGSVKQRRSIPRRESENSAESKGLSESQNSPGFENLPRSLIDSRLPISKSLALKLSEMLTIAVAEAVAQVVEDEPSKFTACTALFRRRNSNSNSNTNVNQNYNYNTNANLRGPSKKQPPTLAEPMVLQPDEEDRVDDVISEEEESSEEQDSDEDSGSEDEPSSDEDRPDNKSLKDSLLKAKQKAVVKKQKPPVRTKNKNKNVNVNTNTNILSFRKDDSNRNEVIASGEAEETTTVMPKQETKINARRRMKHG